MRTPVPLPLQGKCGGFPRFHGKLTSMAEEIRLNELDPRIQRTIWRGLGIKSARQMADETGLDAEQIVLIKKELIDNVDILTINQRRQKMMVNLEQYANEAHDAATNAPAEFKAGLMNTAVAAMKELVRQLALLQAESSAEVQSLNQLRIRELMRLVDEAVLLSVKELAIEHGLDEDAMMQVFAENLRKAAERREIQ